MSGSRRPRMPGVTVWTRRAGQRVSYIGRYTLADGSRPSLPSKPTWTEAFEAAAAEQRKVNRCGYRDTRNGRITFNQLVDEHWLPTVSSAAVTTRRNHASHLGNADGTTVRKGAKAARAARFYLRTVFGTRRISEISPQDVRVWQAEMVHAGYARGSILAKRSLLKAILKLAIDNGWIDPPNPVDAVQEPPKLVSSADERVFTPVEWALLRSRLTGELTLLLVDLLLDEGVRFGEATALRPLDVLDADGQLPARVRIHRNVVWPGRRYTDDGRGLPWQINDFTKGRRDRTLAVSPELFERIRGYIDAAGLTPDALIFDYGRLRAEHSARRARDPLPERFPHGRYVNPRTGRSGAHGRYTTYNLGCRCLYCRNANSEYRFWWARGRGRESAAPWLEPGFLESRAAMVDPVSNQWFNTVVWSPAVTEVFGDWKPTPHDLRHTMVTWCVNGGAPPRVVQLDAGHASLRTTDLYTHRGEVQVPTDRLAVMARMYAQMPDGPDGQLASATRPAAVAEEETALAWLARQPAERVADLLVRALRGEQPPGTPRLQVVDAG